MLLRKLDRPSLSLTGESTVTPVDTDEDNDYDELQVDIGIYVLEEGTYLFTATLDDQCGTEIQILTGEQTFSEGIDLVDGVFSQNVELVFDGQ